LETRSSRRQFARTGLGLSAALASGVAGLSAAQRKGAIIRRVDVFPVGVPFRSAFRIGTGQVGGEQQRGRHVFVRVESEDGRTGWGATNTLPSWSYETAGAVEATLKTHLAPLAAGKTPFQWNLLRREMDAAVRPAVSNGAPFAKSALEMAVLDLAGQVSGLPLHALLGGKVRDKIDLCYAVGIDSPEAMAAEVRRWPACTCFKVKVAGEPAADIERLEAISAARPDAALWLDANQSYQPIALERFFKDLPRFDNLRCFEQPVRSEDWLGLRRAREKSPLPVAIDEGCFSSFDVARVARLEAADLVVLKVPKSGGVVSCLRSAVVAEANGLGLLGSGLTDAGVSFMAAIHLYSTLDLLLPPELNGPQFLADMMAGGIEMDGVTVRVPDRPGLGITVSEQKLRENALQ